MRKIIPKAKLKKIEKKLLKKKKPKKGSPESARGSLDGLTGDEIVKKVFAENSLQTTPIETMSGKVVSNTERGIVRIEGKVTPEKLRLAKQFEAIFNDSMTEMNSVSALDDSPPWTIMKIRGVDVMKTPDNKVERVTEYITRLEKAVIAQINLRKQSEDSYRTSIDFLRDQLRNSESQIENHKKLISGLGDQLIEARKPKGFFLLIHLAFGTVWDVLLNAITSGDKGNGKKEE